MINSNKIPALITDWSQVRYLPGPLKNIPDLRAISMLLFDFSAVKLILPSLEKSFTFIIRVLLQDCLAQESL